MKHPRLPRAGALRLLLLPLLLLASTSRADLWDTPSARTYLNVGPLLSVSARPSGAMFGYGLEASLHHFRDRDYNSGAGVFAQWQVANAADHSRFCGGLQFTYLVFGAELGLAHETPNRDFARTTSLHVAPFVSAAGIGTLSVRVGLPLSGPQGSKPGHGTDVGLVLSLKYPLALSGW